MLQIFKFKNYLSKEVPNLNVEVPVPGSSFKKIENDIKLAVLKKAAQIKKQDGKKRAKDKNYTTVPSSKE